MGFRGAHFGDRPPCYEFHASSGSAHGGTHVRPCCICPDGLVEAVEVRDRSFIMGVQWHPEFFAGTRKMGCLFASLAQEAIRSHTATVDARGRCRLNIKKAPDARSWPTMEYADGI